MNQGRYSLIYKFFKSQIRFGYYKAGDTLPAIEMLHEMYHAAVRTVRTAYLQLQEEGMISLSPGRKAVVTYQASPEQCRINAMEYYLDRKDAVRFLDSGLRTFLIPLLEEGNRLLSRADMRKIKETAVRLEEGDFYVSYFCGREMILKLKNRLALDLYNEITAFYQFPHTLPRKVSVEYAVQRYCHLSRQTADACGRYDREGLYPVYLKIQDLLGEIIDIFITQAEQECRPGKPEAFVWKEYRSRPQICYSAAAKISSEIYIERRFSAGDFLASYSVMAEHYGISFSTVRRVIRLLESLGAVESSQGLGTQVLLPGAVPADKSDGQVRTVVKMFREALQILDITLDKSVDYFLKEFREELCACAEVIVQQGEEAGFKAFFACIRFILDKRKNPALCEIWEKLYEILLLGLPLLEAEAEKEPFRSLLRGAPGELKESLETGNKERLWSCLKRIIKLADAAVNKPENEKAARPISISESGE